MHTRTAPIGFGLRALALGVALLVTGACGDDPVSSDEQEASTATVILSVTGGAAAQTLTWNTDDGSVTGGPIVIPAGQTRTITATQFLRSNGTADPVVTTGTFRLDVETTGPVTFTRGAAGNFAGTLTAGGAGGGTLRLFLHHLGEEHDEYESAAVTVTVQ